MKAFSFSELIGSRAFFKLWVVSLAFVIYTIRNIYACSGEVTQSNARLSRIAIYKELFAIPSDMVGAKNIIIAQDANECSCSCCRKYICVPAARASESSLTCTDYVWLVCHF